MNLERDLSGRIKELEGGRRGSVLWKKLKTQRIASVKENCSSKAA